MHEVPEIGPAACEVVLVVVEECQILNRIALSYNSLMRSTACFARRNAGAISYYGCAHERDCAVQSDDTNVR